MSSSLEQFRDAIISLDKNSVYSLLPDLLKQYALPEIFSEAVYPALNQVREAYQQRRTGIPELLMSLNIVGKILEKTSETASMPRRNRRILLGVIEGDIHDMGKNIVRDVYRGYGFDVTDLGKNVPVKDFVETAIREKPDVVGLSTMMSTTVEKVRDAVALLKKEIPGIRVMVGGAFMNPEMARRIQADGYAENAATLIENTDLLFS